MKFFLLGDKDDHALFNIWRLPRLLRLYNIKVHLINSHDQNHMSKKISPWPKSHVQKFPCPKWRVQKKIPITKITCPNKIFFSITKIHMSKKFHTQKYILTTNAPLAQNQTNAPPKFYHDLNFSHVHTQLPKFFYSHARKFLHVQEKIPTTSCTNKFSHTQQNFSTIPTKFTNAHKYINAHNHKILPCS